MRIGSKQRLYAQLARIGKALASPLRLEMVEILAQAERSVDTLAKLMRLPIANVSHHLQVLRDGGLVIGRKEGLFVHYRLADPRVFDLYRLMTGVGRGQLAEIDSIVEQFFGGRDGMESVSRSELLRRVREGSVVVLDVRPPEEYDAGHVPGAISLPLESLEAGLERLPKNKPIVAYCRGPYCVMAFEAVRRLRESGKDARRLEDGFPEWRAEGLPVAVGSGPVAGRSQARGRPNRTGPSTGLSGSARRTKRSVGQSRPAWGGRR
ncbi:MAG TPA: metalloregulator ArsR/SmtB family transcription factor [Candidatus Eisenbacteria bacterium]|jgi:rhodanese-related sulfurtransferase